MLFTLDRLCANKKTVSIKLVEVNLWRTFRAQCVARGVTVHDEINRLLRQAVKEG